MQARWLWTLLFLGCGSAAPAATPAQHRAPTTRNPAPTAPAIQLVDAPEGLGASCTSEDGCSGGLVCRGGCAGADLEHDLLLHEDLECDEPVGFCGLSRERPGLDARHAMLVFEADALYAILGDISDEDPVDVPARYLGGGDALKIGAPIEPGDAASLVGTRFAIHGETGLVCQATAEAVWAIGQDSEDDGVGMGEELAVGEALDFALGDGFLRGGLMRALRLRTERDCEGALWARAADAPPAPYAALRPADDEVQNDVMNRVRALPIYALFQTARDAWFERSDTPVTDWSEEAQRAVQQFELGDAEHVLVTLHWGEACRSDEYDLNVLYRRRADDADWQLISLDVDGRAAPRLILDVDGDGHLEILGQWRLRTWIRGPRGDSASRIVPRSIPC